MSRKFIIAIRGDLKYLQYKHNKITSNIITNHLLQIFKIQIKFWDTVGQDHRLE